jgi:hypothetical protein
MVNRRGERALGVELARHAGGGVAVLDAQLAARAVAIGVHRRLGHAQFAGNLLGRKVLIDQAQAFALTLGEQPHEVVRTVGVHAHDAISKRRLRRSVYFNEKDQAASAKLRRVRRRPEWMRRTPAAARTWTLPSARGSARGAGSWA